MTLDEEIMLAKQEKELNKKVEKLMESMDFSDPSDEGLLNLKYSETAEMLREFDYDKAIFEAYKDTKDYKLINSLKEAAGCSRRKTSKKETMKEGYEELAKIYIGLTEEPKFTAKDIRGIMTNQNNQISKTQKRLGIGDNETDDVMNKLRNNDPSARNHFRTNKSYHAAVRHFNTYKDYEK